MVSVAEWLRCKIVVLVYAGSIPVRHPITGIVVDSLERGRSSGRGSAGGDFLVEGKQLKNNPLVFWLIQTHKGSVHRVPGQLTW